MSDQQPISIYEQSLELSNGFDGFFSTFFIIHNPRLFEQWVSQWEYGTVFVDYYDKNGLLNDPKKIPYSAWVNECHNLLPDNRPMVVTVKTEGTIPSTVLSRHIDDVCTNDNFLKELSLFMMRDSVAIFSFKAVEKKVITTKLTQLVDFRGEVVDLDLTKENRLDDWIDAIFRGIETDREKMVARLTVENGLYNYTSRILLKWLSIALCNPMLSNNLRKLWSDGGARAYITSSENKVLHIFFPVVENTFEFINTIRKVLPCWLPYFIGGDVKIPLDDDIIDNNYDMYTLVMVMGIINDVKPFATNVVNKYIDLGTFQRLKYTMEGELSNFYLIDKEIQSDILKILGRAIIKTPYGDYLLVSD